MGRIDAAAARDRLLSLLGFLTVWWAGARIATAPALLPGPQRVGRFIWQECVTGALPAAFAATLTRVAIAFILAMAVGGIIGYLAGRSPRANAWIDPWQVLRFMPCSSERTRLIAPLRSSTAAPRRSSRPRNMFSAIDRSGASMIS